MHGLLKYSNETTKCNVTRRQRSRVLAVEKLDFCQSHCPSLSPLVCIAVSTILNKFIINFASLPIDSPIAVSCAKKMSSLADLLASNPHLRLQPNNRIICDVTGHEMLPQLSAVQSHVGGKKYKKALEWYRHDFSVYEPLIIQHKSKTHKLFCTLTQEELNKIPEQVKKHVEGKRFQRYSACFLNVFLNLECHVDCLLISFTILIRLRQVATVEKKRESTVKQPIEKEPEENPDFWVQLSIAIEIHCCFLCNIQTMSLRFPKKRRIRLKSTFLKTCQILKTMRRSTKSNQNSNLRMVKNESLK